MKNLFAVLLGVSILVITACSHKSTIKDVDPSRKFLLENKFNDGDVKKASREFVDKVVRKMGEIKTDKKPVVLFDKIDNKTDEHISGELDMIADRILMDLLDTGEFLIVDKRARDSISDELKHQRDSGAYLDETMIKDKAATAANYSLRGQIITSTQESKELHVKYYQLRLNLENMQSRLTVVQNISEIKRVEEK
ncbi:MAG: hypothetical protein HY606_02960 [Planctomycetes bacterium]|nr:hypothetical protein [Planctomycetota bacterium]